MQFLNSIRSQSDTSPSGIIDWLVSWYRKWHY